VRDYAKKIEGVEKQLQKLRDQTVTKDQLADLRTEAKKLYVNTCMHTLVDSDVLTADLGFSQHRTFRAQNACVGSWYVDRLITAVMMTNAFIEQDVHKLSRPAQ
jgi:hypothetical protein